MAAGPGGATAGLPGAVARAGRSAGVACARRSPATRVHMRPTNGSLGCGTLTWAATTAPSTWRSAPTAGCTPPSPAATCCAWPPTAAAARCSPTPAAACWASTSTRRATWWPRMPSGACCRSRPTAKRRCWPTPSKASPSGSPTRWWWPTTAASSSATPPRGSRRAVGRHLRSQRARLPGNVGDRPRVRIRPRGAARFGGGARALVRQRPGAVDRPARRCWWSRPVATAYGASRPTRSRSTCAKPRRRRACCSTTCRATPTT